jgi:two-component system sensor histidine kinase KdpD
VAQWVYDHAQRAGLGSDTLSGQEAMYLPLTGAAGTVGVLAVLPANPRRVLLPEQTHLLETFASQIALALERTQFAEAARQAETKAETESLRNSLLAAISHDLRTPLAVIAGSSSTLIDGGTGVPEASRHELAQTILDEAQRMTRVVNNLLDMTRLESGAVQLDLQWHVLEELVGSVLGRLRGALDGRRVQVEVPHALPLVRIDGVLIEQVLMNLVENACKYTPHGTPIEITAAHDGEACTMTVRDHGPGLPAEVAQHVFEKFYRAQPEGANGGAGLGLTICRAIVEAHGGTIAAANAPGGGAEFTATLPVSADPPAVVPEAEAA